jgi:hypothetical protein
LFIFARALALSHNAHARTILPDACGDEKVKFDIKTEKDQPAPAAPETGKAQIIFIQTNEGRDVWLTIAPTRFGVDGAWVGANQGNSYFTLAVDPGVHHLCTVWEKKVGVASVTAEAGKVYYYEANTTYKGTQLGNPQHPNYKVDKSFAFAALSEDEGKYRVKASALSVSTPTK